MIENNIENKAKFFAKYLHQSVLMVPSFKEVRTLHYFELEGRSLNGALLLTPLSMITDEDAIEVAIILDWEDDGYPGEWISALFTEPAGYYIDGYTGNQILKIVDYLRSKGYALPYMGLSVEELQKRSWIKLREL